MVAGTDKLFKAGWTATDLGPEPLIKKKKKTNQTKTDNQKEYT